MKSAVALMCLALICLAEVAAQTQIQFREHIIATGLKGGYHVVPADLNRDGRIDLIALSSGLTELEWYENPGSPDAPWPRHVIAGDLPRMINVTVVDPDTLVVAHAFENEAAKSIGIVSVLRRQSGDAPWKVEEIDRLTTSHRLRVADIRGNGHRVVINAPLTGAKATAPDYNDNVPLVYYDPADGFRRQVLNEANHGVVHGIYIFDWNGDRRDDVLTASFSGIHIHTLGKDNKWTRFQYSAEPSSDIAVGKLGPRRIVAAIEPWHGNRVAVYDGSWKRHVIDESLMDGHTILTADFDGDGRDEVVAGCRGGPRSVFLYRAAKREGGPEWTRQTIDNGGIAAASCAAVDLNGDRRPDLACIGSGTANLKWYENLVKKRAAR